MCSTGGSSKSVGIVEFNFLTVVSKMNRSIYPVFVCGKLGFDESHLERGACMYNV